MTGWLRSAALGLLVVACGSDGSGVQPSEFVESTGGGAASGGSVSTGGAPTGGSDTSTGGNAEATGGAPTVGNGGVSAVGGTAGGTSLATGGAVDSDSGASDQDGGAPVVEPEGGSRADSGAGGGQSTGGASATGGATAACECTDGACCDGCHFKAYGSLCFHGQYRSWCNATPPKPTESPWCSAPHHRYVEYEYRSAFCTGHAAACPPAIAVTNTTQESCPSDQVCVENAGTGLLSAACAPCPE